MMDLNRVSVFLRVAEAGSFTLAARQLGVSRSAVSQTIRKFEDECGVALVSRTTRSVKLTEAGSRLYDALSGPLREIGDALERTRSTHAPSGQLKLAVTSIAEGFLSGPLIPDFVELYPDVTLDITIIDEPVDIVAEGYDAGVTLGETIDQDMIAVAVTGPSRQAAVATPEYFERHGRPEHPRDLLSHRCIGWRSRRDLAPYRWEFEDEQGEFDVNVREQILTNDLRTMIQIARSGGGVTFGMIENFEEDLASGRLVSVLDAFLPEFDGFYLYYPSRRLMAPKLRALVDHVQHHRRSRNRASASLE